ncbi:MAG: hypothetical protein ACT4PV_07455, partial [Planctomycetaceae bacterium]
MTQRRPLLATLLGVLVAAAPAGTAWCEPGEGAVTPRAPAGNDVVPGPPANGEESAPKRTPPGERGLILRTPDVKCERPGVDGGAPPCRSEFHKPREGPAEVPLAPPPAPRLGLADSALRAGRRALPPPPGASSPQR